MRGLSWLAPAVLSARELDRLMHALLVADDDTCAMFKELDPKTRATRRGIHDRFCENIPEGAATPDGTKPFAGMRPRHIRKRRDAMAAKKEAPAGCLPLFTLAPGYVPTGAAPEGQQRLADRAQHVAWLAGAGRPDFPAVAVLRVATGATMCQASTAAGIRPDGAIVGIPAYAF